MHKMNCIHNYNVLSDLKQKNVNQLVYGTYVCILKHIYYVNKQILYV